MASTYNRGTRAKPRWYASVKLLNGDWKAYPTHAADKATADRRAAAMQLRADQGLPPVEKEERRQTVAELAELWMAGLTNRTAKQDQSRTRRFILPQLGAMTMPEVTMQAVARWIDTLRAREGDERLATATQRHIFDILSRFLAWGVERGHVETNACRMIPPGSKVRPAYTPESHRTWIQDPEVARAIFCALPDPIDLIFLVGYTSGLRPGETCGLRLSDCAWLTAELPEDRVLRVRFNRLGPLKEDKGDLGAPKVKWAPTSDELVTLLLAQVDRRRAQGAKDEDLLFVSARGLPVSSQRISKEWARLSKPREEGGAGLDLPENLDLYAATRHSYASRNLDKGEKLSDVARSLGHADERVTQKHYSHVIKITFPVSMRRGLGLAGPAAVIPMARASS